MRHIKPTRKKNNFGGISTVIVMALVIAASIAIAVYFIAYFIGLSSSVAGTANAIATVGSFSTSGVSITVKNTGTVGIDAVMVEIAPGGYGTSASTQYILATTCSSSTTCTPIGSGNTLTIYCTPSTGGSLQCTASSSQGTKPSVCTLSSIPSFTGKPTCSTTSKTITLNAGQTYKVSVIVYYDNGKTQLLALGTYTAS